MTTARTHRAHTAALLLPALIVGCSTAPADTQGATRPSTRADSPPAAAPADIEKIASLTGCDADIRMEADELREGVCTTAQGSWIVTTFPAEKFQRSWLDAASMYGGTYLVGPRWTIGAEPELLKRLRAKVGGDLRQLRGMNSPAASSPSG
ncbi:hypothetical protein [Streptomyces scopuliridis]|nr:hypothetical protein [Streptomyces scopuliridis]